jgi:hypothetical protein
MTIPHKLNALVLLVALATAALAQPVPPGGPGQPPAGAMPHDGGPPDGGPPGPMPAPQPPTRIAVDIDNGVFRSSEYTAAVTAGRSKINATAAKGLTIQSGIDQLNAVYVHGTSRFTLSDSRIEVSGKGTSDFDGIAAGVLAKDDATLELRNVRITTNGVVSSAVTATDRTTLKVYRSTLIANGGPVPSGYVRRIGPGMMEPPTPLGIVGTARTTLAMGSAKAYYYDSTIMADGWGALSTDAARGAYLEANRCDIRVTRSGYGTYADNGATVVINDSKLHVASFGGIIGGQANLALNNTETVSGGNAVMIHSVMGSPKELAVLSIKGGRIDTTNAAIVVKSANADITLDGVQMRSKNGDLLLGVVNDDGFATKVKGQPVAGIQALVKNTKLEGNFLQLDTERHMTLKFVGTQLKGRIHNAALSLDATSRWTANADSQVLLSGPLQLAQLDAPRGVTIEAKATPDTGLAAGEHRLASGGTLKLQ